MAELKPCCECENYIPGKADITCMFCRGGEYMDRFEPREEHNNGKDKNNSKTADD